MLLRSLRMQLRIVVMLLRIVGMDAGESSGDVVEDCGDAGESSGDVVEDCGDAGESSGDVVEDCGDAGESSGDVVEDRDYAVCSHFPRATRC